MKRWLRTILIFLLLGAVVNVAVAWGCSVTVNSWDCEAEEGHVVVDGMSWLVHRHDAFGATSYLSERARDVPKMMDIWGDAQPDDLTPGWAPFAEDLPRFARSANWLVDSRGWPMRSMWSQPHSAFLREGEWEIIPARGGIRSALSPWTALGIPRVRPLTPIWPGFAVNTIFYGLILWLLLPGRFVLRRIIRRKRGRCIACGYDLRGDLDHGCPECGWNREEEVTA